MDRGIPTEEVLAELRSSDEPVHYLVGTPKGRLTKLEKHLAEKPWQQAREHLRVKLFTTTFPMTGNSAEAKFQRLETRETYVLAESTPRKQKERAMRQRKLKAYWQRLGQLREQTLERDTLLEKLGAARDRAGRVVAGLINASVSTKGQLTFALERDKLRASATLPHRRDTPPSVANLVSNSCTACGVHLDHRRDSYSSGPGWLTRSRFNLDASDACVLRGNAAIAAPWRPNFFFPARWPCRSSTRRKPPNLNEAATQTWGYAESSAYPD